MVFDVRLLFPREINGESSRTERQMLQWQCMADSVWLTFSVPVISAAMFFTP